MGNRLPHPPLQEVIFELKWRLDSIQPGFLKDPHYQILIGTLYGKLRELGYTFHEPLQTSNIPDEMVPYIIQHRFRPSQEKWPLVQIGSGILTLNDTIHYSWPDFSGRIRDLVENFFLVYPEPDSLQILEMNLRYINALTIPEETDPKEYLKQSVGADIVMPEALFINTGVMNRPVGFDIYQTFPQEGDGTLVMIRYIYGHGTPPGKFTWETTVHIDGETVPKTPEKIIQWCNQAHDLTHDWFLKMCSDELMESFR